MMKRIIISGSSVPSFLKEHTEGEVGKSLPASLPIPLKPITKPPGFPTPSYFPHDPATFITPGPAPSYVRPQAPFLFSH